MGNYCCCAAIYPLDNFPPLLDLCVYLLSFLLTLKGLNVFPGFVPLVLLEGCLMRDLRQLVPVVSAEL